MKLLVNVVIEPDSDDRFHGYSPACRGVHIDGATEEETLERMREALTLHLQSMVRASRGAASRSTLRNRW